MSNGSSFSLITPSLEWDEDVDQSLVRNSRAIVNNDVATNHFDGKIEHSEHINIINDKSPLTQLDLIAFRWIQSLTQRTFSSDLHPQAHSSFF
jgi:hypothetical protein